MWSIRFLPSCEVLRLDFSLLSDTIHNGSFIRWRRHYIHLWHVTSKTALHNAPNNVAVIALENDIFERCKLSRFIVIGRDFSVFSVCIFPRFEETFTLLFKFQVEIGQLLRREFTQIFS